MAKQNNYFRLEMLVLKILESRTATVIRSCKTSMRRAII